LLCGGDHLFEQAGSLCSRSAGFGSDPCLGNGSALLFLKPELPR
jgi:hypothetical protein